MDRPLLEEVVELAMVLELREEMGRRELEASRREVVKQCMEERRVGMRREGVRSLEERGEEERVEEERVEEERVEEERVEEESG